MPSPFHHYGYAFHHDDDDDYCYDYSRHCLDDDERGQASSPGSGDVSLLEDGDGWTEASLSAESDDSDGSLVARGDASNASLPGVGDGC